MNDYSDKAGKKGFPSSSVAPNRTKRGLEEEETSQPDTPMEEEAREANRSEENKRPRTEAVAGEGQQIYC